MVEISAGGPLAGLPLAIGELLCAPPSLATSVVVGSEHAIALPDNPALAGMTLCTQALTVQFGPLRLQLQNALDVTLGTL